MNFTPKSKIQNPKSDYDFLYETTNDGVATLTFNRPDVLNALTFEVYAQFRDLLPRIVGMGRASELLMLGDTIDAPTADRYGLVNRVVLHDELMPAAYEWAKRLAQGPTQALSMTKRMINSEWNMDLVSALEGE